MPVKEIFGSTNSLIPDLEFFECGIWAVQADDWIVDPEDFLEFSDWITAKAAQIRDAQEPISKPDDDGWIEYTGDGEPPVLPEGYSRCQVRVNDGTLLNIPYPTVSFDWRRDIGNSTITHYKPVKDQE